jgi:putative PIN family toxin of toxin-antitoxin system
MRVVLDTNVIISSYLTPQGRVARILNLWEQEAFDLLVSEPILQEYARVLAYPRHRKVHKLNDQSLAEIVDAFRELAEIVDPLVTPAVISDDPDDDHFLACAESGHADYIISGDSHLRALVVYEGIPILSPAEFLSRISSSELP